MQIAIEIPEAYKKMIDNKMFYTHKDFPSQVIDDLISAIRHSTPLPEHYGDLIDKKEVYKKLYSRCLAKVATEVLNEVHTIVPATKEGEEECT